MAKVRVPQVRTLIFNTEEIGMGFNSDTGLAVGTALDFDVPTKEPGQEAHATAEFVTSHEALMESLNVSSQAQGRYGFSSGSAKVKFSKNTSYNSVSTFVLGKLAGLCGQVGQRECCWLPQGGRRRILLRIARR